VFGGCRALTNFNGSPLLIGSMGVSWGFSFAR
jgi:hypothetical protein